ncbi:MAG TPA: L-lactate permease [Rhizomicrobium sp.]|jgi:lactate permease|nr:L-lactate permease [Rhizomicrobium sp.]
MFHQLLTPVGGSLGLSFLVAAIPIMIVLLMLGVLKRPAWQSSLAALAAALVIAIWVWQLPVKLALLSTANGVAFALWPIMWIVFAALTLYNVAVQSGRFDAFRRWILAHLPDDRRIILIVIGYGFGALLEGVTGFGAPVAICASLLIMLGFKAVDAVVYALLFNTAPVAFGSLGIPITTLAGVTGLPADALGAMVGRQLPIFAFLLPFYVIAMYGGLRSVKALFPVILVAGGAFAGVQFVTSNLVSYVLTDVLAALSCLVATVLFLRVWKPVPDPEFAVVVGSSEGIHTDHGAIAPWQGWLPWLIMCAVVILWTIFKLAGMGQMNIQWPGLHNQVFITLYEKPYAAIWSFQPLATGTAVMVTAILTAGAVGMGVTGFFKAVALAFHQVLLPTLTVTAIVGLAFLMNFSGMNYTLGLGVASAGMFFPLVSAFLGWLAVFLSGSDSSGNALFGNLQVVAANKLGFDPVLMAATNSSGGVFAKMISPQNIATGVAVSGLKGQEGKIFSRTFLHSVLLTVLLGILVFLQQHVWPWMIPPH